MKNVIRDHVKIEKSRPVPMLASCVAYTVFIAELIKMKNKGPWQLTGMLVPIATTTKPIVNLSTFKMHPARPTRVTMPEVKMAIHTIEAKNETRKYFRLCACEQFGIVHVNIHKNGNETMKRIQSTI